MKVEIATYDGYGMIDIIRIYLLEDGDCILIKTKDGIISVERPEK